MPNWCSNILTVSVNSDDEEFGLQQLIQFIRDHNRRSDENSDGYITIDLSDEDIENSRDINLSFTGTIDHDDNDNWYEWNCNNWGTKWDVVDPTVSVNLRCQTVIYQFETAWSPPVEWLEKATKKYPHLEFHMESEEGGCDFYVECDFYTNINNGEYEYIFNKNEDTYMNHYFEVNGIDINEIVERFDKGLIEDGLYLKIRKMMKNVEYNDYDDIDFLVEYIYQNSEQILDEIESIENREFIEWLSELYDEHQFDINISNFIAKDSKIVEYYNNIKKIERVYSNWRLRRCIRNYAQHNLINREMIEFAYCPPNENSGTFVLVSKSRDILKYTGILVKEVMNTWI